jgi:hypothetical protein
MRIATVKVLRGALRLSVVIALLVSVYFAISGYLAALDAEQAEQKTLEHAAMRRTLLGSGYE